jgi:hypothetical protein
MNSKALSRVGPPPERISGVDVLPTRTSISIIGTAVGNIIAIIPTVHEEANNARLTTSRESEAMSIIVGPI